MLITGATFGIGCAAALAFAAEGAKVGFCGRTESAGRKVEREIRRSGGQATCIRADVRVPDQVRSFVDQVANRYGRLDVAINNAGIHLGKPLHETTVEEWDNVHLTNARGVFLAIKYEIPRAGTEASLRMSTPSTSTAASSPPRHHLFAIIALWRFGRIEQRRLTQTLSLRRPSRADTNRSSRAMQLLCRGRAHSFWPGYVW